MNPTILELKTSIHFNPEINKQHEYPGCEFLKIQ